MYLKEIIITAIVVIIIYIVVNIVYKKLRTNYIDKTMLKLSEKYNFSYKKVNNICDYIIEKDGKKYLLKLCYIPSNSCVTINAKDTICLTYGGRKNDYGRIYPHKRYLNEMVRFLNYEDGTTKIIAFYPETEKIMMYINESEIKFVKSSDSPYRMKYISFSDLDEKMNDIL